MRSEPVHLGGISLDFAGISPRWDENFPHEHVQVGQPGKVFFNHFFFFFFRCYLSNIRAFALHEWPEHLPQYFSHGFTSMFIVKIKKYLKIKFLNIFSFLQ